MPKTLGKMSEPLSRFCLQANVHTYISNLVAHLARQHDIVHEHVAQNPTLLPLGVTYIQSRGQILRAKWSGPPMVEVDPSKAAKAAQQRLDAGISTLADECAAQGRDWQDVLTQRAKELRMMESLGLFELEAKAKGAGVCASFVQLKYPYK